MNWTAVAPEAELHLAVQLHAVWNAAVDNSSAGNATALHLFGVRPGQCPPGTYRCAGGRQLRCSCLTKVVWRRAAASCNALVLSALRVCVCVRAASARHMPLPGPGLLLFHSSLQSM